MGTVLLFATAVCIFHFLPFVFERLPLNVRLLSVIDGLFCGSQHWFAMLRFANLGEVHIDEQLTTKVLDVLRIENGRRRMRNCLTAVKWIVTWSG